MVEFGLTQSGAVTLTLEPDDDGIRVTVAEEADGYRTVYSSHHTRDFVESDQKRGTIANKIKEHLGEEFNADKVASEFDRVCSRIAASDISEEKKEKLRAPAVQRLLEETEQVEVFPGETTRVRVTLTHDGETRPVEFTSAEWVTNNPAKLRERYYNQFYDRIEVGKDEWIELTTDWEEQQVVRKRESMTKADMILEDVVEGLKKRVKPHASREKLGNGDYTAWFDEGNQMADGEISPPDANVVWVKSSAVVEQLEQTGADRTFISELSPKMYDEDYTYSTSRKKSEGNLYPFAPDALEITEHDVFHDDDEATEVEP